LHWLNLFAKFSVTERTADIHVGHWTKSAIFENSRWRTAAILKINLSSNLSAELSSLDQIWQTDADFHSQHGHLTKNIEILQIQHVGRMPYLKTFFWLYLGVILAD